MVSSFSLSDFFLPEFYSFHRPFQERYGWQSIEKDGKHYILLNVLGVAKDDIKVDVLPTDYGAQFLQVTGKTHNELFNTNFDIEMKWKVSRPLDEVNWNVENGFMTIELVFKQPEKPLVKINAKNG